MKTYNAIIQKEGQKETSTIAVDAKNLSEAKEKFAKLGKLICYGVGAKVYFN